MLHRCGRRNDPKLAEQILADLMTLALRQPAAVETALGLTVTTLLRISVQMQMAVEELEAAIAEAFDAHPLAPVLRLAPGLGPVLAARILAEVGDDPDQFATAGGLRAFAGTAPVTRASGRSSYVKARKVRIRRLGDACHWWAFAMLTKSAGARALTTIDERSGDHHNAAPRNLANKLVGRLWWSLTQDQQWDETTAWPNEPPTQTPTNA